MRILDAELWLPHTCAPHKHVHTWTHTHTQRELKTKHQQLLMAFDMSYAYETFMLIETFL